MSDVVVIAAIAALVIVCASMGFALVQQSREFAKERRTLIRGTLAKNATDFERSAAIGQIMEERAREEHTREPDPPFEGMG